MIIFDLREQLQIKLNTLGEEKLNQLIEQNKMENTKNEDFTEESKIHDINSGLLYYILRKSGWFNDCDISFTLIFNSDGVGLKRKSDNYKNAYGFWLIINELPVEIRFKKENMILIGLFSGKTDNQKSSSSLFNPFVEEFNKAFYPWKIDLPWVKLK